MGRPRKYATNAEKQAAYRSRKKPVLIPTVTTGKIGCPAFTPSGTKCKLCGRNHA